MPVNTLSAAVHITPTVIKTFIEHSKRKGKKFRNGDLPEEATDDLVFDEAFHIVKSFILLGTKNTVESLQAFTNTHVPAPFWCAVSPVSIPLVTANRAADTLIEWFGPEDLKHVVGGERWWQVRGLDGIDAEWITEREYLSPLSSTDEERKLSETDEDILRMEKLEKVMLYVHGGGYFWGSINTHRYQIIRYARKFKGRAFAVNYRKAPQYPWPCPLQDVIAAYLYLIDPPPTAIHKAIPPSKIVFAGDSAGGGLCVTVLTVLRDMGLPLPAGAVLISPWVDLTHSFPSILENTKTDIIPPHGFLSKPSESWPVDLIKDDGRVAPTVTNPPPKPGHADTLLPSASRLLDTEVKNLSKDKDSGDRVQSQAEMLTDSKTSKTKVDPEAIRPLNDQIASGSSNSHTVPDLHDIDFWQPKPPKVLMNNPREIPLELRAQIHMYATTEQLSHPLVSPILQGSLGNLCPLYILAGDGEVLRDEIIYLAHRAAHPDKFPVREGVLRDGRRQKENMEKFQQPTKVHVQVYDGMCHVLTVFTFSKSAKYAYRSIAEFVQHVTGHPAEHLERNPFPELDKLALDLSTNIELDDDDRCEAASNAKSMMTDAATHLPHEPKHTRSQKSDVELYEQNKSKISEEVKVGQTDAILESPDTKPNDANGKQKDIPNVLMIRERVDIHGKVRPMEPMEELPVLKMRPQEIGIIKEGPLNKWWSGQKECDKRYRRNAVKAAKKRRTNEEKAKRIIRNARDQGLLLIHDKSSEQPTRLMSNVSTLSAKLIGKIDSDRRWGPFDLTHENVPPTAIAGRRDTNEALALLNKSIYHTAPITHQTIPKRKVVDIIRAAFDPHDDPTKHPKQSVSEQQVRTRIIPGGMHGLRVWDALLRIFMRESSKKTKNRTKRAAEVLGACETGEK